MQKKEKIYEGKAKNLYATDDPDCLIASYIEPKGVDNNAVSSRVFELLEKEDIQTHFIKKLSDREMLVKRADIIPIEVIVRNVVAGSLSKRMGINEGQPLKRPIIEYCYKDNELDDSIINDDHILVFDLCSDQELINLRNSALRVNDFLVPYFNAKGSRLVDFKLEFGRYKGEVILVNYEG